MSEVVTKSQTRSMGQRVLQMFSDVLNSIADDFENLPHPIIRVFSPTGSTVTATANDDGTVLTATEANGIWQFKVPHFGYWTVKAVNGSNTYTREVYINEIKTYPMGVGKEVYRYGYRIKEAEPDPYERVEYIYDAKGMTPAHMDFENEVFDYGSWADVWFVKDNKPLMLKSDGTVDYYLDPNDYTKKADGTDSDVANADYDGNAMAQFPLCWIYRYEDDTYKYEIVSNVQWDENYKAYAHTRADDSIADYFYFALFEASENATKLRSLANRNAHLGISNQSMFSGAQANGRGWNVTSWLERCFITTLLVLIGKSVDTQTVFGTGVITYRNGAGATYGNSSSAFVNTGTLINKGRFFGYTNNTSQVKVFCVEGFWGNFALIVNGIFSANGHVYVSPHNITLSMVTNPDVVDLGTRTRDLNNSYIMGMNCTQYGMIPSNFKGSATTYYCDTFQYNSDGECRLLCAGHRALHQLASEGGAFAGSFYYTYTQTTEWVGCHIHYIPPID